jgi:hypothetical protein
LVFELESTAAGCQWLLDRWAELRERWDRGHEWGWFERFCALRLLGKQALGVESDPVIDAILPIEFRVEDSMQADDVDDDWEVAGLDELDEVLDGDEVGRGSHDTTVPRQPGSAASSQAVASLISAAIARLMALAREHRECATAALGGQASRLSFDAGDLAERLRRYQVACNRNLLRTLDAFFKVRRHADESELSPPAAADLDGRRADLGHEAVVWIPGPDLPPGIPDSAAGLSPHDSPHDGAPLGDEPHPPLHSCIHILVASSAPSFQLVDPERPLESIAIVSPASAVSSEAPDRPEAPDAGPDAQKPRNEPGGPVWEADADGHPWESDRVAAERVEWEGASTPAPDEAMPWRSQSPPSKINALDRPISKPALSP